MAGVMALAFVVSLATMPSVEDVVEEPGEALAKAPSETVRHG
jgi:hypothetical protein